MDIQEGALIFSFATSDGSIASQYDTWAFYRNQFINVVNGTKAVDFIYFDSTQKTAWLIEVKDYRHPDTKQVKPSELGEVVASKVRDTLAGLVAASCNANDPQEKSLAKQALKAKKLRVVLHMEQNQRRQKFINPADVLLKLKQMLKAIDPHPSIVHKSTLKTDMDWTVKSLSD